MVTDSSSALHDGEDGLTVVPLIVRIGDREYREGVDIGPGEVAAALRSGEKVTTSQVPMGELRESYRRLLDEGAEGVVSVHLSSKLSGTVSAARTVASEFDGRVVVVDSLGAGMALGYPALAAARAASKGEAIGPVAAAAQAPVNGINTYFYLDTLEYLRRGGRISTARALVGTALSVKPILALDDGVISMIEKVRTPSRGLQRLAALAEEAVGSRPAELTVHHLQSEKNAVALAEWLTKRFADQVTDVRVSEIGAALGAHCGPGVVGVVACPEA